MQLFFHNVGLNGATRDFPKTVFNRIPIKIAERSIPLDAPYREELIQQLHHHFPSGSFNCWGVPAGAESAIKDLNVGDVMLLVKTIGGEHGEIPALGVVKVFFKVQMRELSKVLWGELGYPYVFFFNTESIFLSWTSFKDDVGYKPTYSPPGYVSRVSKLEKIQTKFNGVQGYIDFLRTESVQKPNTKSSPQTLTSQLEETSPPSSRLQQKIVKEQFKAYKGVNYSADDNKNQELGLAGELLVLRREQEYLKVHGRSDLALEVRHVSQLDGDGLGYDILSYNLDGSEKYIEVKTTTGSAETPFYITGNEVQFSERFSSNYYLYRVYQFDSSTNTGKFYIQAGTINSSFNLLPIQYRATIL
jgi:hypothetical protein